MKNRILTIVMISLCMLVGGARDVYAQSGVPVRFEVEDPDTFAPDQSFWQSILRYIGVKAVGQLKPEIGRKFTVNSSAYASSPYQTDSTPCITASGTTVRPGVIATNFLPLGTIVSINNKKYIVEDRMAKRFNGYYLDIWFPSTSEALEFGRKKLEITIVAYDKPGAELTPKPSNKLTEAEKERLRESLTSSIFNISKALFSKTYDPNKYDVDCSK